MHFSQRRSLCCWTPPWLRLVSLSAVSRPGNPGEGKLCEVEGYTGFRQIEPIQASQGTKIVSMTCGMNTNQLCVFAAFPLNTYTSTCLILSFIFSMQNPQHEFVLYDEMCPCRRWNQDWCMVWAMDRSGDRRPPDSGFMAVLIAMFSYLIQKFL